MRYLFDLLFTPPPMPPIVLPAASHLTEGVMGSIAKAFELVYFRGVHDGFVGGVLVALLLAPHVRRVSGGGD